ncbi:MAG: HEAT repeat domain-containing protein [Acidobacteriota bacterium]|nr:HEAT repeat domain-containing protein [Acidobacteriota bacterium]
MTDEGQNEINALVEAAKGTGSASSLAALRLVESGMPAVGPVIEALRQSAMPSSQLMDIIPEMESREAVPLVRELLDEQNPFLPVVAVRALGRSKDEGASETLLNIVRNERLSSNLRGWAADALAELGDQRAVPELLALVRGIVAKRKLRYDPGLVRFAVIALARLGNQDAAPVAASMMWHRVRAVREEGALTLKHVVGVGLFPALRQARRAKSSPIRSEAIEAISYLGLRQSIEELIAVVAGDDFNPDLTLNAVYRLRNLTGEEFKENISGDELRRWWEQHESAFEPGVCYRLGAPLDVSKLGALLRTSQRVERHWLLKELQIITGRRFGLHPFRPIEEQEEAIARAEGWLDENGGRFKRGAVYKHGYEQSTRDIFDAPTKAKRNSPKRRGGSAPPARRDTGA